MMADVQVQTPFEPAIPGPLTCCCPPEGPRQLWQSLVVAALQDSGPGAGDR